MPATDMPTFCHRTHCAKHPEPSATSGAIAQHPVVCYVETLKRFVGPSGTHVKAYCGAFETRKRETSDEQVHQGTP